MSRMSELSTDYPHWVHELAEAEANVGRLSAALRPFLAAHTAYVNGLLNFEVTGSTEAERRFSEGERNDRAAELAFEALAEITPAQLDAVCIALAHVEPKP